MALTQYPGLQVMARNSAFVYKGRAVDIATVARNLGVAYVLESSVRKTGQRIRITAQIVTAKTGVHVWAERYDHDLNDIFRVQDEITLNIVTALGQRLSEGQFAAESRMEAWRAAIQGMASFADTSEVGIDRTLDHIHKAVRIDPDYAFAWGVLAQLYINRMRYGWSRDLGAELARSFEAVHRANGIDPDLDSLQRAEMHSPFKGNSTMACGNYAVPSNWRLVVLSPNSCSVRSSISVAERRKRSC